MGEPVCAAAIENLPPWALFLCGAMAILILASFILVAFKTWEHIRPNEEEIRERESMRKLKVKGSLVQHPPHRPVLQNSVAPAFRQAGLGAYMPLMETHPFIYPNGEESEKIDMTKFLMHLLHDGRLVVHETHCGRVIITHGDLASMPFGVVLERVTGANWAWRAHAEQFGPEGLSEHAEMTAVGDKYANEWVFSFAPIFALIATGSHHGASWAGPVPWVTIALALGAAGLLCALIGGPSKSATCDSFRASPRKRCHRTLGSRIWPADSGRLRRSSAAAIRGCPRRLFSTRGWAISSSFGLRATS